VVIKSFTAESVAAALKLIREELGSDAVILKTRVCSKAESAGDDAKVEVTACIDEAAANKPAVSIAEPEKKINRAANVTNNRSLNTGVDSVIVSDSTVFSSRLEKKLDLILDAQRLNGIPRDIDRRLEAVYLNLLDADISSEMVHRLIHTISDRMKSDDVVDAVAGDVIREELKCFLTDEIDIQHGMTLVFAGMPGAGKTSVLAKLATHLIVDKKLKVRLASLDREKVSAYEEINGYADILDVPCDASDEVIKNTDSDTVLLVDTPSLSTDRNSQAQLDDRLSAMDADMTFLVFSVCSRSSDIIDYIPVFKNLQATSLIATHLDETSRWGGVPALASELNIPLAFVANSPGGMGRMMHPDADLIADVLLKSKGGYNDR